MLHWEPSLIVAVVGLIVSVVALFLTLRPRQLKGHSVTRISAGVAPAGAERGNKGLLANPLYADLASRESLSRTVLGLSRTPTIRLPVTETAFMFADSWGFKGYRARLKTDLNFRCRPWTWPKCIALEMRLFLDEPGRDQELLACIPMGRVWVWPRRAFRIEPGAVYVDIDPSLPQQPIEIHVDSDGRVTIPPGAIRIEVEVEE